MSGEFIPLSVPNLRGNELKYLTQAIETQWVSTGGPYVSQFEEKIANYVNCAGAVSCQNGTSGLHLALLVSTVTPEDEVIVPTLTFIAAVNPVKYVGASAIFMDCDESFTMDPIKLEKFCNEECDFVDGKLINKKTKKHIKAVMVVHVFGNLANMEKIVDITEKYNLTLIEDATEALGSYYETGRYKGRFAGTIGKIGVYSFNGNKIITTGGGGMVVSQDEDILKRARHLVTQAKADELYFIHDDVGYNYRMTNLQAALGLAQLEQLEDFIKIKKENYDIYKEEFAQTKGLTLMDFRDDIRSNHWLYALYIDDDYPLNRDEMIKYLQSQKIQTRPIWALIHEQKPYLDSQNYKIEKAKDLVEHIINIPCSTNLTSEDARYVASCIKQAKQK